MAGRNPLGQGRAQVSKEDRQTLSVTQAVKCAKVAVNEIPLMAVVGEVSGFRGPNARSGHCYFQVKDDDSAMDVIVWRGTYQSSGIQLRDGIQVVLAGTFDVYTGSGRLSFIAKSIEPVGEGLLRQQVEALARKLNAEGLMDDAAKRRIPRFCQRVAVVTSLSGAVIDDVKRTLRRRNPLVELMCVGCAVQGQGAPETIIRALKVAEAARPEAILLVRGGGSFEDLMTFNDEALARAIAASGVPIVTGIGHEPDTTIADMVADRRCSTPTAAAESIAPAIDEIVQAIEGRRQRMGSALAKMLYEDASSLTNNANRMGHAMRTRVAHEQDLLNALSHRRCLEDPMAIVEDRKIQLTQTEERLHSAIPRSLARNAEGLKRASERLAAIGEGLIRPHVQDVTRMGGRLDSVGPTLVRPFERDTERLGGRLDTAATSIVRPHEAELARLAASLEALSPVKVLARGYAIATDAAGHVVTTAEGLSVGDDISVQLGRGTVDARVTATHQEKNEQ